MGFSIKECEFVLVQALNMNKLELLANVILPAIFGVGMVWFSKILSLETVKQFFIALNNPEL